METDPVNLPAALARFEPSGTTTGDRHDEMPAALRTTVGVDL